MKTNVFCKTEQEWTIKKELLQQMGYALDVKCYWCEYYKKDNDVVMLINDWENWGDE